MKTSIYILFILLIATSSCSTGEDKTSDVYYKKAFLGNWAVHIEGDGIEINAIDTYTEDGKIHQQGELTIPAGFVYIEMESKWEIVNGVLISEITSLSPPNQKLIGSVSKDTIISINKDSIKLRDKHGKLFNIIRVDEKS